jgi:hypothetical protein
MAKVLIKTAELGNRVLELRLGVNRIGRNPENDFAIDHPSISGVHCELQVSDGCVTIRDLESTNGTFVNGLQIRESKLVGGETFQIGAVELLMESADCGVAIPRFANAELPAPPVQTANGAILCPRHHGVAAGFRCTHCKEVMCGACVHRLRRSAGSIVLMLCPLCSHNVEPFSVAGTAGAAKKKSFFSRFTDTVKWKLTGMIGTLREPPSKSK